MIRSAWFLSAALALSLLPSAVYGQQRADFDRLGRTFLDQHSAGRYRDAEQTAVSLERLAEGPLQDQPQLLAQALYWHAWAVHDQGRYDDALPLYRQALELREKVLGAAHVDTAWTLFYLGWLYDDLGRYDEAAATYQRCLAVFERQLGPEHAQVATCCHHLAGTYAHANRFDKAEPLYKRSLSIRQKLHGAEHLDVALVENDLGWMYDSLGRYAEAEQYFRRALQTRRKLLGRDNAIVAVTANNLACLYHDQGRYGEAEKLHREVLAIRERLLGADHPDVATTLGNLGLVLNDQGRYAEAEPLLKRALAIREESAGGDRLDTALAMHNLALVYDNQGRYSQAEQLYRRALRLYEDSLGADDPEVAGTCNNLATLCAALGRYGEAESLHKRALEIRRKTFPPNHPDVALSLHNLAALYAEVGRYTEAEQLYGRALAIRQEILPAAHPDIASTLNQLGLLMDHWSRFDQAERPYAQALAINEQALGREHPSVAVNVNNLATVYEAQGRYVDAEPLHRRALAIRQKALGPGHPVLAESQNNLACLYEAIGRDAEAEPLFVRSLEIKQACFGQTNREVALALNNLAHFYASRGRHTLAEPLYKQALAIYDELFGKDHPASEPVLNNLGLLYQDMGQPAGAEAYYQRALDISQRALGADHPGVAIPLANLASLYASQDRDADAQRLIDRAIAIRDTGTVSPWDRYGDFLFRAKLAWKAGRRDEAVADLRQALDLADQQRGYAVGTEHERAGFFGWFSGGFERMVAWQGELGDVAEAFSAAERARARSLVDQMDTRGIDLLAGVPEAEARQLRQREQEARSRVATLQRRARAIEEQTDLPPERRLQQRRQIEVELSQARQTWLAAYADVRNASPAYRLAVAQNRRPLALDELRSWLKDSQTLLLEYVAGQEGVYLFVVGPHEQPRIERLSADERQAGLLGIAPGPLTATSLQEALIKKDSAGVLAWLRGASASAQAHAALHALWELLVPAPQRAAILDNRYRRIAVIPDGALAQLPFETLLVRPDDPPTYLLDVGPPIQYAPSATILKNLADRQAPSARTEASPVLSVGDVRYSDAAPQDADTLADLRPRARYQSLRGGKLAPLPFAGLEIAWVTEVFRTQGLTVTGLLAERATEVNVRRQAPGRRIVHLACHGLVDQAYGNLFGALALTPGASEESADDDGFLTLAETYELDLGGCELAILSACETNFGPQQQGEGVWALSRGFLVAGSRRVVASNWLVDDEAAASLVSYFSSIVAAEEKKGAAIDYADALRRAKLWVRQQKKWNQPCFWATFVLLGPG